MLPYYHPTSVVLVDDDQGFLNSCENYFDDIPCVLFTRGDEALKHIRDYSENRHRTSGFANPLYELGNTDELEPGDRILKVKTSQASFLFSDAKRFERPSVAIIDYKMPGMSGMELSRLLNELPIMRLMLTGVADEKTAVEAFNAGIIDAFIMKNQSGLPDRLEKQVRELQHTHFEKSTKIISSALELGDSAFVNDENATNILNEVIRNRRAVEYYFCTQPQGFMCFTAHGEPFFIIVLSDDDIRAARETARESNAPAELLTAMTQDGVLTLFPTASTYYMEGLEKNWQSYLHPAVPIHGKHSRWWYSVLDGSQLVQFNFDNFRSYADFLSEKTSSSKG